MSSFKKYKCLKISEKQKVTESVEEGERKVDVAKAFEIALHSLSTILKNKEKIFSASSTLPEQNLTFDDYVLVDTDIAVWGSLSAAKIVALDYNNTESDEDESEELTTVTLSEAKVTLNNLRNFFLQNHVDADILQASFVLEKSIDKKQAGQIEESLVIWGESMRPSDDDGKSEWTVADFSIMMVAFDLGPQQIDRTDWLSDQRSQCLIHCYKPSDVRPAHDCLP
ncbi:hypothetical protein TNCV_1333961 [Trichonephila clavipes]|nr:hypothetical protein TNCV_1333961 [Trichonephila clavipes]